MSVTDKLISLGTKIGAAKTHCNEALIAKGGTEASTLWEVGDRIGEISDWKQQLIDLIECDITELDIPNDISKIGDYAFTNRIYLSRVEIPDNITAINAYVFYNCSALTTITIPDSVTSIGDAAFAYCLNLTNINFGDNSQLQSIDGYAFNHCENLTTITIPQNVTSIGSYAFSYCPSFTSLILPRSSSIVSLGHARSFNGTPIASGTGYIYVPQALLSEYQSATNWSTYSAQFRAIEDYPEITGG